MPLQYFALIQTSDHFLCHRKFISELYIYISVFAGSVLREFLLVRELCVVQAVAAEHLSMHAKTASRTYVIQVCHPTNKSPVFSVIYSKSFTVHNYNG